MEELIYTSAAAGLEPGASGYCTVARTKSLPLTLARRLESLSVHRTCEDETRPTSFHVTLALGARQFHILSRVVSSGLDYSGRPNKLAHHLLIDPAEVTAGPAQLLVSDGLHSITWSGEPRFLTQRKLRSQQTKPKAKSRWSDLSGDDNWLPYIAERLSEGVVTYLIYPESVDVLSLLLELEQQLEDPWQLTFSTHYTSMPPDVQCLVRCVPAEEGLAHRLASRRSKEVLDLTNPRRPPKKSPMDTELTESFQPPPLERPLATPPFQDAGNRSADSPPPFPPLSLPIGPVESKSWDLMPIGLVVGLLMAVGLLVFWPRHNPEPLDQQQEHVSQRSDAEPYSLEDAVKGNEAVGQPREGDEHQLGSAQTITGPITFEYQFEAIKLESGKGELPKGPEYPTEDATYLLTHVSLRHSAKDEGPILPAGKDIRFDSPGFKYLFFKVRLSLDDNTPKVECSVHHLFNDLPIDKQIAKAKQLLETQRVLKCIRDELKCYDDASHCRVAIIESLSEEIQFAHELGVLKDITPDDLSDETLQRLRKEVHEEFKSNKSQIWWLGEKDIDDFERYADLLEQPDVFLEFDLYYVEDGNEIPVAQFRDTP